MIALATCLAGGLGAAARFVVDGELAARRRTSIPTGTLAVNVIGSLLLGLLVGAAPGPWAVTVLGTGFLGGFTTFSAASVEVVRLRADGRPAAGAALAATMLLASLVAATLGVAAGRL